MKEEKEISISIKEINELSYIQKPFPSDFVTENIVDEVGIGLSFHFDVNIEKGIFKFLTKINYTLKETDTPLLELENEIVFEIENISVVVKAVPKDKLKMDNDFLITLAGVSIGTTRGILSTKTKGNILSKVPLPILNPKEVIEHMDQAQDKEKA
jgi:hypothetical protein